MTPLGLGVPDLSGRRLEAELMDQPGLDRARHVRALRALARVNRVSLSAGRVWREVERVHRVSRRSVRVLDVACGGGDVLAQVGRAARRAGVPVDLAGCDVSPVALDEAQASLRAAGYEHAELLGIDATRDALPRADLVCSSLFLHHLEGDGAIALLRSMASAARSTLLVQDLRRTSLGYVLAHVGLTILTRSEVARHDGPRSVASAFTVREAVALCEAADLRGAEVRPCWPQRFTIRWSAS